MARWRTFARNSTQSISTSISICASSIQNYISVGLKHLFFSQALPRGYMSNWQQYGAFLKDNLAWLAYAIIYIAIILRQSRWAYQQMVR